VQSVFTPSKWCRRRLQATEIASALDIPNQFIMGCTLSKLKLLSVHPSRGLEQCAKALLAYGGAIDRGGVCGYVFGQIGLKREHEQTREKESSETIEDIDDEGMSRTADATKRECTARAQEEGDRDLKAVKADDAKVPIWL
jgi:hypothetical protein